MVCARRAAVGTVFVSTTGSKGSEHDHHEQVGIRVQKYVVSIHFGFSSESQEPWGRSLPGLISTAALSMELMGA